MKFFTFTQNNSGGRFDFDEDYGITRHVIVEARNYKVANKIFDGIREEYPESPSCPCCGDRWYDLYEDEGTDSPQVYGKSPNNIRGYGSKNPGKDVCVHYLDGHKEWFGKID